MRFLILNSDYPPFLRWLYAGRPGLQRASYAEQLAARNESLFGAADFSSAALRRLGHEAWDIHVHNEPLQRAWARERGVRVAGPGWRLRLRGGLLPWPEARPGGGWAEQILTAQVRHYRPDVLLSFDVGLGAALLDALRPYVGLLVIQRAALAPQESPAWRRYDLALSSFPPTVTWFRERGVPAELHRLGFDPRVLAAVGERARDIPLSFVGSLERFHSSRIALLERLCAARGLAVWGPGVAHLPPGSPIRAAYRGPAWGRQMFEILARSQITLNHHGDVPPHANNMRLYEATGMGALLLTDAKPDLGALFTPGVELAAYADADECLALLDRYLARPDERRAVAQAGQRRTLREHSYAQRMAELADICAARLTGAAHSTRLYGAPGPA